MRLLTVLVLTVLPVLALADVADIVNNVRVTSCNVAASGTPLLRSERRLNEAAQHLADGASLESATTDANYGAKLSASVRIRTLLGEEGLIHMLTQRFCDIVGDARLTEIGAYQYGAETWLVLATPFTPAESVDVAELDQHVLELINESRQQARRCGRTEFASTTPLQKNAALERAAQAHAQDMAANNFLAHAGSSGSKPGDRATLAGYDWSTYGENIAAGQTTADEVVATWLASSGHCETLMNPHYTETGIAHAINRNSDKGTYWVQIFGRSR